MAVVNEINPQTALLLFAHGSTLCGSGEALVSHAQTLRERGDFAVVQIGYLNYTAPLFPEAVEILVGMGITTIVVTPFFLIQGYFVTNSLPKEIDAAQSKHPELTFIMRDALRQDDLLADALFESAINAKSSASWREPLQKAAQFCRPVPDCPLFGTPSCPKMPVKPQMDLHG